MATSAHAGTTTPCARCKAPNAPSAQYCEGCGEPLWESCNQCSNKVRIGQTFCHACGNNLLEVLEERRTKLKALLKEAVVCSQARRFDEAESLAQRVATVTDFRLRAEADQGKELAKQFQAQGTGLQQKIAEVIPLLELAIKENRAADAQQLAAGLPEKSFPEELKRKYDLLLLAYQEKQQLEAALAKHLNEKKIQAAASVVERLSQMEPESERWKTLSDKLARELLKAAVAQLDRKQYSIAKKILLSVPTPSRDADFRTAMNRAEDVLWLRDVVAKEPFELACIKPLAQRLLSSIQAEDEAVAWCKSVLQPKEALKPLTPWGTFPARKKQLVSWLGQCPIDFWSRFHKVSSASAPAVAKQPTRFHQAIGLALMAFDSAPYPLKFTDHARSGGISKLWQRKKNEPELGWGLDVGDTGVRVVAIERVPGADTYAIKQAAMIQYPLPLHRPEMKEKGPAEVRKALTKIVEHFKLQQVPVHASLSARLVLGRFVDLPPVPEKELLKLIEKEVSNQIPFLELDEIASAHWIGDRDKKNEKVVGTPLMLAAARKSSVKEATALLNEVGFSSIAIVPAPIALLNLARIEFNEKLQALNESAATSESSSIDGSKPPVKAIAILDVGCESSSLLVLTQDRCFFRTTESGGDDFSVALAKGLTKTYTEVESIKSRIGEAPGIGLAYQQLEPAFANHWLRMQRIAKEVTPFLGELDCQGLWICGGGGLLPGYSRACDR